MTAALTSRLLDRVPRAVLLVVLDRHDARLVRLVDAGRDLPPERLEVRPLEVPQRFGAGPADAVVLGLSPGRSSPVPLGSMRGSSSSSPRIAASSSSETSTSSTWPPPGSLPAWPSPLLRLAALADRLALFAVALPDAAGAVLAVAEVRHVELRHGNADEIATLAADHLAVRDVLPQVLADPAADDLPEAALIALDFHDHGVENDECRIQLQ